MQVKSIAECSKGSIQQYFRPSLSNHLSLRSLFCLFLSGRFTQVLLTYVSFIVHAEYSACIVAQKRTVYECLQQNEYKFTETLQYTQTKKSITYNLCR